MISAQVSVLAPLAYKMFSRITPVTSHKFHKSYFIGLLVLGLVGCDRSHKNSTSTGLTNKPTAIQWSIDLRQKDDLDVSAVAQQLSLLLTSEEGKKNFFDESAPVARESTPAQRLEISAVVDALTVQSQRAAAANDQQRAKLALIAALDITQRVVQIKPSKAELYAQSYTFAVLTFAEIDVQMGKYPLKAQTWSWYKPTRTTVKEARFHIKTSRADLLQIVSSSTPVSEEQWNNFSVRSFPQILSDIFEIKKALGTK